MMYQKTMLVSEQERVLLFKSQPIQKILLSGKHVLGGDRDNLEPRLLEYLPEAKTSLAQAALVSRGYRVAPLPLNGPLCYGHDAVNTSAMVGEVLHNAGLHVDSSRRDKVTGIVEKYDIAPQDVAELVSVMRPEESISSEYALIPAYSIETGSPVNREKPMRRLAFCRKWLQRRCLKPENLALVFASGNSMAPTIHDNNTVMIDSSQTELMDGSIYVIRSDSHLVVKRVQKLVNNDILLLSDNEGFQEQMIGLNEINELDVIGRVIWIGKDI